MYCITHKIICLSQVICANGSRKLFRFRVRQFSSLKYYFTWEITPFRNLFSVCPGFRYIGGPFYAGFSLYYVVSSLQKTSLYFVTWEIYAFILIQFLSPVASVSSIQICETVWVKHAIEVILGGDIHTYIYIISFGRSIESVFKRTVRHDNCQEERNKYTNKTG